MDKEKLQDFISSLQKIRKPPKNTFNLGLIIKESKSKINSAEILNEIKKKVDRVDIEKINYNKASTEENVIDNLVNAFKKEKWVFLEIEKDISSPLFNQLKHLANYNSFQLLDYEDNEVFEMKIPENSRLVVFAERELIENKITYPHFYTLFGPILSLK